MKGLVFLEVGRRIRELRGGSRQKDWAAKIGCDQGYISQVENGVTKPSLAFLKSVSGMTGASIDWILTGRGVKIISEEPRRVVTSAAPVQDVESIVAELSKDRRLLAGVERLLWMDDRGREVLEALGEMDEDKVAGLAALITAGRR